MNLWIHFMIDNGQMMGNSPECCINKNIFKSLGYYYKRNDDTSDNS